MIGTPGVYEIRATFAGNEHLAPADDLSAQFVLNKQTTTLKLDPFTTQGLAQFAATLLGSKKRPLGQQTLVFVVSRVNGGYTTVLSGITDLSGRAVSEPLLLPDGSYTVTVYFGQSIPGTDINLASALYGPSSDRVNFSLTSLLDNFNRRAIAPNSGGQHWFGNLGGYRIDSNHLDVGTGGTIYWRGEEFGVNQEAYITFVSVDATSREQGLLLKVQGGKQADFSKGAIKVIYDAQDQAVRVETVRPGAGTVYTNIPVAFQAGDVLGAEVFANGQVWIFKNGTRIAVVTMDAGDQAFFNSRAGQLGLRFISAGNAVLDNFGGRTIIP